MKAHPKYSTSPKGLRARAEQLLGKRPGKIASMSRGDVHQLVHELQVHQIELEMQNEEMRRSQLELEQARDRYEILYDFAPSAHLTLSSNGEILEANLSAAQLLELERRSLIRQKFTRFIPAAAQDTFFLLCRQVFSSEVRQRAELDLVNAKSKRLVVQMEAVRDATSHQKQCRVSLTDITERKHLERQILEICDREEARLGHDLHDGLCQQLVSLAFDANSLERRLSSKRLPEVAIARRIADDLDQATTQARELSRGLFPIRLETEGLPSALEELARTTRERFHIKCCFQGDRQFALQGWGIATHLYRIAQEAVNNAVQHGQPSLITIRLRRNGDTLELSVEDDGRGIASAAPGQRSGMGLHIMAYRARNIGGVLGLAAGLHGGTKVTCRLPLGVPRRLCVLPELVGKGTRMGGRAAAHEMAVKPNTVSARATQTIPTA